MKLARTKNDQAQVYVLTTPAQGPGYDFPQDAILTVSGPLPAALAPHVALFDGGPILPNRKVLQIDSVGFEAHVAAEVRRETTPVRQARRLTRAEIVAEVFHDDESAFDGAGFLGFPKPDGLRVPSRRSNAEPEAVEAVWSERFVSEWVGRVLRTAAALTR